MKIAPTTNQSVWIQRSPLVLTALLALLAAGLITLFIVTSLRRIAFPFPLDHLEGSMALAVARVAHGQPLYTQPSFQFIAYMYSPAYFYVAGFMAKLLGPGFLALRLVSLLSTLGCFVLISALVFAETKDRVAALAGAGLYAAAYPVCHYWFDLGRVDSFYVFLVLLALLATRWLHPVFAGLAWTVAFLAKQAIIPVALVMLCFDWKRPRRVLAGVGTFLVASFGSTALFDRATHGWFSYYLFAVPDANSDLRLSPAASFPFADLLYPFGLALVIVAAALLLTSVRWASPITRFHLLAGASLILVCWFVMSHAGSAMNATMPAYAYLSVAFGIALSRLMRWLHSLPTTTAYAGVILLLLAASCQLASQLYSPSDSVPSLALRTSQQQFVDWLHSFPGDVFVVSHPYEAVLAGKPLHAEEDAIHDALRPGRTAVNTPLIHQIQQDIDQESLDAIVLDRTPQAMMVSDPIRKLHSIIGERGSGLIRFLEVTGVLVPPVQWFPTDWRTHYPILGIIPGSDQVNPFMSQQPRYVLLPCRAYGSVAARSVTIISIYVADPPCARDQPHDYVPHK
jgi:hypothetical protein